MYNKNLYNLNLPEKCRLICISDIHGSLDLIITLLKKCEINDDYYLTLLSREILGDKEIEAVSVCTPNDSHAPIAIDF